MLGEGQHGGQDRQSPRDPVLVRRRSHANHSVTREGYSSVDIIGSGVDVSKPKVLFLCTGNTARSQMAEGFLRAMAPERFEAFSAGLEAGGVNPLAVQVMAERGMDISSQRSKPLTDFLGQVHFGYLVTVCDRAERECPIFPGMGQRLHWSFPDPAAAEGTEEERLEVFREVRDAIEARLRSWLAIDDRGPRATAGREPLGESPEGRE
jgi:arsenate reductase